MENGTRNVENGNRFAERMLIFTGLIDRATVFEGTGLIRDIRVSFLSMRREEGYEDN